MKFDKVVYCADDFEYVNHAHFFKDDKREHIIVYNIDIREMHKIEDNHIVIEDIIMDEIKKDLIKPSDYDKMEKIFKVNEFNEYYCLVLWSDYAILTYAGDYAPDDQILSVNEYLIKRIIE